MHLLRVVVRLDLSRMMIDMLLRDLRRRRTTLVAEQPATRPVTRPDLWTAPDKAAAHSKKRNTPLRKP